MIRNVLLLIIVPILTSLLAWMVSLRMQRHLERMNNEHPRKLTAIAISGVAGLILLLIITITFPELAFKPSQAQIPVPIPHVEPFDVIIPSSQSSILMPSVFAFIATMLAFLLEYTASFDPSGRADSLGINLRMIRTMQVGGFFVVVYRCMVLYSLISSKVYETAAVRFTWQMLASLILIMAGMSYARAANGDSPEANSHSSMNSRKRLKLFMTFFISYTALYISFL
jgi:hypothetical protein